MDEIDLRYTEEGDAPYLESWLLNPEVHRWLPMGQEGEIRSTVLPWISFAKYRCSLTALFSGTVCGMGTLFLMPYRKVAHHCLFKVVVDPAFQRKGVGTALIRNLKNLARRYFRLENIQIEIFEGNPIEKILRREGFVQMVRQERFIKEGDIYRARIVYEVEL